MSHKFVNKVFPVRAAFSQPRHVGADLLNGLLIQGTRDLFLTFPCGASILKFKLGHYQNVRLLDFVRYIALCF